MRSAPTRRVSSGCSSRHIPGTLFLDEVSDLPMETQGKVVRALHEQRFTRLGGERPIEVDVRVVAATNRDLASEIQVRPIP